MANARYSKKVAMKRLYILVNDKLKPIYGCVQGGHAVAQFMLENPEQEWNNEFLIYLYANVMKWIKILKERGIKFTVFREPDLNNSITAIACQDDSGELFKDLSVVR
jgi:hypothetical protein